MLCSRSRHVHNSFTGVSVSLSLSLCSILVDGSVGNKRTHFPASRRQYPTRKNHVHPSSRRPPLGVHACVFLLCVYTWNHILLTRTLWMRASCLRLCAYSDAGIVVVACFRRPKWKCACLQISLQQHRRKGKRERVKRWCKRMQARNITFGDATRGVWQDGSAYNSSENMPPTPGRVHAYAYDACCMHPVAKEKSTDVVETPCAVKIYVLAY